MSETCPRPASRCVPVCPEYKLAFRSPRDCRPADAAALVRAGHLEEVEPGVFRRSRLPSRADVHGEQRTPDPMGVVNPDGAARNNEPIAGVTDVRLADCSTPDRRTGVTPAARSEGGRRPADGGPA